MADYRVGVAVRGNVGADAILRILFDSSLVRNANLRPRNPLPAWGGGAPEPIAEVKLLAPTMFRRRLARAVTADDYARLAELHPAIQRAAAMLRWNGSWTEVPVAIDPLGGQASAGLLEEVRRLLEPYRRVNHDVVVIAATYVPLLLGIHVCVQPGYLRGHVEVALRKVLGSRRQRAGEAGLFHPDRLTFGQNVHVSEIVSAAQAVAGVASVEVTALQRLHGTPALELEESVLRLGPLEIARLDNDPNFPENGRLDLRVEGGR
jgi:predicted phage baseplate assembly protein